MLPKLCHLDNDLVIIIIYILRSSHDSYTSPGDIFFLMVYPVWPWPVIKSTAGVNRALESNITTKRLRASHPLRETHLMIVLKLKLQSVEWRGACPFSMPSPLNESEDDADLHAKWGKYTLSLIKL